MFQKTMIVMMTAVAFAAPLTAQEADKSNGTESRGEAQVGASAFARAEAAGIPVSLLESKIAEGRAKGVSTAVIEAAIDRRADALIRASSAFEQAGVRSASTADLSVAADALEGGVSLSVLQSISGTAPQERRAVAIAALTQLVAAGALATDALVRVETALERGPDALANLAAEVGVNSEVGAGAGIGGADVDLGGAAKGGVGVGRP